MLLYNNYVFWREYGFILGFLYIVIRGVIVFFFELKYEIDLV